jgi:hypothetical protein
MVALNSNNVPPEDILAWCRNLTNILADGAIWGIPRSGTTFRIDKKKKQFVLIIPGCDNDDDFRATKYNFSFIGWDVVRQTAEPTDG